MRDGAEYDGVRGLGRLFGHLLVFLVVSALGGVMLAGMTLPLVGSVGLAAKSASDHFEDLPSDFETPALPQRSKILADDGSLITYTWSDDLGGDRVVVPWSQISQNMPHALVAIEDIRFYQHGGVDLKGTVRALVNNSRGGNIQGGSTIAQQYVKNVLLLEAGTDKVKRQAAIADTFTRKITELKYAVAVEKTLSKDQILERYLNLVYFGNGSYGVEAAAERYFSTTSDRLTITQAALLAALVNSPSEYDPFQNPAQALARRNIVLQDMSSPTLGYLTAQQAAQYQKTPLGLKPTSPRHGCITAPGSAAFECNYVYQTFINDPAYGATQADRIALWDMGGLTIHTTFSAKDEKAADKAISTHTYSTDKVASALAMVQPGTGQIKAIAQSKPMGNNEGETYLDLAADPAHNGSGGYQAGSSFKIFVGLAALENGRDPSQVMSVPSPMSDAGDLLAACPGNGTHVVMWPPDYNPNNDDGNGFTGPLDQAFWFSVNTYFLTLETQTGLCKPAQIAASMGVTLDNDNGTGKPLGQFASFTLGTNLITPIEMAEAYATIAAQGTYCAPYVIAGITDAAGRQDPAQHPSCRAVLDPNIANELTAILRGVLTQPGATADGLGLDRPSAGKTGTTNSSIATWFDGYTPQLATAVWTGFIRPDTLKGDYMGNMSVGGQFYYGQIFGATISAPIWHDAMSAATAGDPAENFTAPHGFPPEPE
ncbi:MAG TPA: transglycosylase domain-containing protein [Actinocrinis sp.]|uniref:transglycosylase domain-containing protein n=1 Tax=Actinocrinis sp. TaxID=1920516 RepID=UPI002DDCE917|nr:transglycosylase domain-containing protein [Actinocrinis sp.]HEV2342974.1 transglycosylase domain-containing protein [Actinocrinis sp.]